VNTDSGKNVLDFLFFSSSLSVSNINSKLGENKLALVESVDSNIKSRFLEKKFLVEVPYFSI